MIQSFVTFYSEERPHWLMWWLKTVVSLFQFLQDIYVFCRPGGPYWEKLCPWSWARPSAAWEKLCPRPWVRPEAVGRGPGSRPRDRPRPANNVFIFFSLENYFIRNIFVDFVLQQFHTLRVRLTFRSSKPVLFTEVFKRRDSVFADFKLSNKWFTFHGDF